ncbi:UNVERIFIED_CONTAM: Nuclear transcription factor Y subunit C-4 [Sesamum calycinum]|uniref:Nuclear transcription factor Y subunit C-4 n=1 Tax=Sesamum calycinum TaxID=2727403 RepID=A0AAW2Q5R6_9LAMI
MDHVDQRQQLTHQSQQQQQPGVGVVSGNGPMAYPAPPYQTASMVATGTPAGTVSSPTQPPTGFAPQQQLAYHQAHHFHNQQQQQQLQGFWANQMQEIDQTTDFKNHSLPLARIKKIMKADEDVRMISAEAPVIFAKACEMFILELTLRSWIHTEENKRRTLQKNDIAAAISRTDPPVGAPGMIMGKPVDQAALYANQQPRPPLPFMPWPQSHMQHPSQQPPSQQQPSDS